MTANSAIGHTAWRLQCANLSVRRGGHMILHDVSLELRGGECLSLIGPNGAGKTTLMLAMLGLLPPAGGSVCLNGDEMHRLPSRARGRFAAYVPQVTDRIPAFRVYDVVAGGRFPHVPPLRTLSAADRTIVERSLEQCGLTALAERSIDTLSGGERQKALIAAAIAQDAAALFLDEPSASLDPAVQVELVGLLRAWHQQGRGIVLISHDLNFPVVLGGRVVALRGGRVVADGPVADVICPDRLAAVYSATFELATTSGGKQIVLPHWWAEEP